MKTIRELVDNFIYKHMERLTDLMNREGQEATMDGVICLQERSGFTQGALIENAMYLYIHYYKNQDVRTEEALEKIHYFITFLDGMHVKTWGKLAILRGLSRIKKEGLLETLQEDVLSVLREKTDYGDFLDKETMELKGLPSNYYHVAMACSGYREQLEWESEDYSERCKQKLMEIMMQKSDSGWMDEQVPYGRYDRYSMAISAELADTLDALGKPLPQFIEKNLKDSAQLMLDLANEDGDGVTFGRSLSVHGDCAPVEVLSTAFRHHLVDEEFIEEGMSYCLKLLEKILTFWYRPQMGSFDIWNDGRTTNGYRQKHRILEVNLDMTTHLLHILENMEEAGLADYRPDGIFTKTDTWNYKKTQFMKEDGKERALYVLKRGAYTFSLPLVGAGTLWKSAAYLPFPAKPMLLEAPPESYIPFLIPEVTLENGTVTMPIQYIEHITEEQCEDSVTICVKGTLCRMDTEQPVEADGTFETCYCFKGNRIEAEFTFDACVQQIRMEYAGEANVRVLIAATEEKLDTRDQEIYFTPHGRLMQGKRWTGNGKVWKYSVDLL